MRTPSGRHARITKFAEGFVHFSYYDVEGGEGLFHSNLLLACDYIPAPDTHVPRMTDGHDPLPTADPEYGFYRERAGRTLPKRPV